jgi:hypothetical protein
MILLLFISLSTQAAEFNHIKLNSEFQEYLNRPQLKSAQLATKSLNAAPLSTSNPFIEKIRTSLLGANTGAGDLNGPFPSEGEQSLLYEEIRTHLEASHREIGLREVANLDFLNTQFNMGQDNFSGFSWQKPYGVVHVWADRQVTPNLFGSNWLIQDTFTFDIEATTFLTRSNEAGLTSMSDAEIGAFAGITFKRVFTYYHYANSYSDGLKADFSKLFLPFVRFNPQGISKMNHEEIMKREDEWTASAGGLITTPPYYGFSFSGGILTQFSYQNLVSVQNIISDVPIKERFRIAAKSTKSASIAANISLQLDFFKILKLTIMNYDLSYEYASAKEFTLGMSDLDWNQVISDQGQNSELKKIIQGYGQVKTLEPYVVELDEYNSSALTQRGSLLIWGRLAKNKTEQVRVIKDNSVKVFFKSYAQNVRLVQNIFSRLFSAVVYKLLKLPLGTKNAAIYSRQVNLEYEATHPQAGDPNVARIDSTQQFSFVLNQSYEAARTDRWIDKKFKNDLIWFVDSFTTLPKDYKTIIRQEQLKGPIIIESNLRVEQAGFEHFIQSSEDTIFGHIAETCGSDRVTAWRDEKTRDYMLKRLQVGNESCVKNLGKEYLSFLSDYRYNFLKPSLSKFKKFMTGYFKEAASLNTLTALFGKENTFINGQLKATTSQGGLFVTSFSSGQFRGMGVIDNYKRSVGSRQPASILNE